MLRIRLRRMGRRNRPFFWIVVAEHTAPVKGKFLEKLGYYDPITKEFSADKDRVKHWISCGAQLSDTVHNLFVKHKIIKGRPIVKSVKPKKKKKKRREGEASKEGEKAKKTSETSAEGGEK
ncbi:30S ribosomal protein S16 [bacterium]|nr:30S ribosomal protein S16 [bacterium]